MRYFRKEVPKTPIWLPNGNSLKFDTIDGHMGFFQTDDTATVDALKRLEAEHRGGVFEVSPQTYDAEFVKKKPGSTPFDFNSVQRETVASAPTGDTMQPRSPAAAVPVEVSPVPAPAPAPSEPAKGPRIGRRKPVE